VKDTVAEFLEAATDGENGRACALTTDVDKCLGGDGDAVTVLLRRP
jgi:hypothetical protein